MQASESDDASLMEQEAALEAVLFRLFDVMTLDTGLTYLLAEDWQIDIGVNIGATRAADDIAAFIGMVARF